MNAERTAQLAKLVDRGLALQQKIEAAKLSVKAEAEELAKIKEKIQAYGKRLDHNPEEKGQFKFVTEEAKLLISDSEMASIKPKKLWKYLKNKGKQALFWSMVSANVGTFVDTFGKAECKQVGTVELKKYAQVRISPK